MTAIHSPQRNFWFYFLQSIRVFVGILFIFSGLIKANDPSGLAYKMQEYFEVWGMAGWSSYSLTFSVLMIAFEIVAGVALLLGYFYRLVSFLLFLLMLFFTYLTAYAVFSGKIKECGCFGDCIPLQAKQSFYKDLILLALSIILLLGRKQILPLFKRKTNTFLIILSVLFSFGIQWWTLNHLPFFDCLPFKQGNNIWEKMQKPEGSYPDEFATIYKMENIVTKETKEITDQEYLDSGIWEDTTWVIQGEPITKLTKKGNDTPPIQDFQVIGPEDGEDYTKALLKEPGYNFVFFLRDPLTAKENNMADLRELIEKCNKNNVGFFILASGSKDDTEDFLKRNKLEEVAYFTVDATASKTAMRTNPGLMLIKAGTVKGKWSYLDYPKSFKWSTPEHLEIIH